MIAVTENAAHLTKALAVSQPIFQPKSLILLSQGQFLWKDKDTLPAPHSGTFNGGEGVKTIRQPSYSPNTATGGPVAVKKR
jgi:hypothetical protein